MFLDCYLFASFNVKKTLLSLVYLCLFLGYLFSPSVFSYSLFVVLVFPFLSFIHYFHYMNNVCMFIFFALFSVLTRASFSTSILFCFRPQDVIKTSWIGHLTVTIEISYHDIWRKLTCSRFISNDYFDHWGLMLIVTYEFVYDKIVSNRLP